MEDYAIYEVRHGGSLARVTYSTGGSGNLSLGPFEQECKQVVCDGFLQMEDGEPGFNVDPYKAAESILADHYGYAKMIEAHYEWKPGIVY